MVLPAYVSSTVRLDRLARGYSKEKFHVGQPKYATTGCAGDPFFFFLPTVENIAGLSTVNVCFGGVVRVWLRSGDSMRPQLSF